MTRFSRSLILGLLLCLIGSGAANATTPGVQTCSFTATGTGGTVLPEDGVTFVDLGTCTAAFAHDPLNNGFATLNGVFDLGYNGGATILSVVYQTVAGVPNSTSCANAPNVDPHMIDGQTVVTTRIDNHPLVGLLNWSGASEPRRNTIHFHVCATSCVSTDGVTCNDTAGGPRVIFPQGTIQLLTNPF